MPRQNLKYVLGKYYTPVLHESKYICNLKNRMTEDDTKAIAYIKRHSGLENVCKVSIFEGTNPETKEKVTIKVYDHGMEAGNDRYWIEAETETSRAISQNFRRMEDALEFVSWENL